MLEDHLIGQEVLYNSGRLLYKATIISTRAIDENLIVADLRVSRHDLGDEIDLKDVPFSKEIGFSSWGNIPSLAGDPRLRDIDLSELGITVEQATRFDILAMLQDQQARDDARWLDAEQRS